MEYPVNEKELLKKFKESIADKDIHITSEGEEYINLFSKVLNQAYTAGVKDGMKI